MNKTIKLYGILFFVVILLLALLFAAKKDVVNWSKNFDIEEKSPFGLYVFNQEVDAIFNGKIKKVHQSPYSFYQKEKEPHNILFIEHDTDLESWKKILNQVSKGSHLMVISDRTYSILQDTIDIIRIKKFYFENEQGVLKLNDFKRKNKVEIDKLPSLNGFSKISKTAEMLGTFKGEGEGDEFANFIKIPHGEGIIYYHTEPLFLTNYHLLKKQDYKYAEDVFSYLPNRETIWFMDKMEEQDLAKSGNDLGFILKHPALKYAWWIFLGGLFLMLFFKAKRTQRVIPIITPKENKSLEFVKSIGNLYLQEGNITDMMRKKTQYFLHHVRTDFFITTEKLDAEFSKKLHLKTGASEADIKELASLIEEIKKQNPNVNKMDLLKLDQLIDTILKK